MLFRSVLPPDGLADEAGAAFVDRLLQREALAADDHVAEALVGRAVVVRGGSGGGKPPLVDAAAVQAEGVQVVGVQLQALARLEEGARHPAGCEAQEAAGAESSASTLAAVLFLMVLSWLTVFMFV